MFAQPPLWFILIAFICAIGPLVFIHELGHYWVARLFGVGAEQFSIGFGREIAGWTDKRGTRWKVGWLQLGGYVRFVGDMNPASQPADDDELPPELRAVAFHHRPWWQRFLIVLAGPVANFLLAIAIFAAFFVAIGMPAASTTIERILPGEAASRSELRAGDRIESIAGVTVKSFNELRLVIIMRPDQRVPIEYQRGGEARRTIVKLDSAEVIDEFGQEARIGMLGIQSAPEQLSMWQAVPEATRYTVALTRSMIDGLGQIITGQRSTKDLGGPLKLAQIAGQRASLGAFEFIQLIALISINLGFINLLPVPMLDGGHLVFYAAEAVRRKPVSERAQDWAFRGGLALLIALLLFTTVNDLASFGLFERLGRLIG